MAGFRITAEHDCNSKWGLEVWVLIASGITRVKILAEAKRGMILKHNRIWKLQKKEPENDNLMQLSAMENMECVYLTLN